MRRKFTVAAVTAFAALSTLAVGFAGSAMADPPSPILNYQVEGTGGYGVRIHTAPTVGSSAIGILYDGENLPIVCQDGGDSVTDTVTGVTSIVWDELLFPNIHQPLYVTDLYANTPGYGDFSWNVIPLCSNGVGNFG